MNLKKAPPGKLDALKAMMGDDDEQSAPPSGGGDGQDVLGPEAGGGAADASGGPSGGSDMDAQMSDVCNKLEDACQTLEGINPDDEQDSSVLGEAKAHLDHAVKLINSLAHQEQAEGDGQQDEPTEEGQGGQMNQKDSEL